MQRSAARSNLIAHRPTARTLLRTKSTSTSLAAGKGTSTHGHVATSLGGQATAVIVADSGYSATERTLYPEVVCDGGSITAGVLQVFLEFLQFDTDV